MPLWNDPLPADFTPLPLLGHAHHGPAVCLLVRTRPDPVAGPLVVLHDAPASRSLLGALVDQSRKPLCHLRIVVQAPVEIPAAHDLAAPPPNSTIDRRFNALLKAAEAGTGPRLLRWALDQTPAPAWYYDPATAQLTNAGLPGEQHALLCRDDALLTQAGLPPYSSSPHRYLLLAGPDQPDAPRFVPLTPNAPTSPACLPASSPIDAGLIPVNPLAGPVILQELYPIPLARLADLLSGAAQPADIAGRSTIDPAGLAARLDLAAAQPDEALAGRLFLGIHGQAAQLLEVCHLKLALLAQALQQISSFTRHTGLPLLNLTDTSFGCTLAEPAAGLPVLWTAHTALHEPGDAVPILQLEDDTAVYASAASASGATVYQPADVRSLIRGEAQFRWQKTHRLDEHRRSAEGLIITAQPIQPAKRDLLCLTLPLAGLRLTIAGSVTPQPQPGQWALQTAPFTPPPALLNAIDNAQQAIFDHAAWTLLPRLSTAADLHSYAVLATRILLAGPHNPLADAREALHQLAAALKTNPSITTPAQLANAIHEALRSDPRLLARIGPQQLHARPVEPADAIDLVPLLLWADLIAWIIRLMPGESPLSYAEDLSDAPPAAPHRLYDQPQADLHALLIRTRSLVVMDWRANREIHAIVRQLSIR